MISEVLPKADMPTDKNGNVADIIMDPISTAKRTNTGRLFMQYQNAASRDLTHRLREYCGLDRFNPDPAVIDEIVRTRPDLVDYVFETLKHYYSLTSSVQYEAITSPEFESWSAKEQIHQVHNNQRYQLSMDEPEVLSAKQLEVKEVLLDEIDLTILPNNKISAVQVMRNIRQYYPPLLDKVTFRGKSGLIRETIEDVLIGSMYIILLDKTGSDWSGVSSAKLQHFGVPSKITNADKHSAPGRLQPVKYTGEAEGRSFAATIGGDAAADILDQSNNPIVHKEICRNIYLAEKPTAITHVVDRKKFPRGFGRPVVFVKHQLECGGWRLVRRPN